MLSPDALNRPGLDAPAFPVEEASNTLCEFSLLSGPAVTIWSSSSPRGSIQPNYRLSLQPDRPVIIGRSEGYPVPYLDPAYQATAVMPGSGQRVLTGAKHHDCSVSRGHFMLRGAGGGILLVNGVPHVGGGIRPPTNGTWLLAPQRRHLEPGEEYRIEGGSSVVLQLPNGAQIQIGAA